MSYLDTILEKVFPYEGIPETMLLFFTPVTKHFRGSPKLVEEMERKHKTVKNRMTFFDHKIHSYNGQPASIEGFVYMTKRWFRYGRLHRDNDLPAIDHFNEEKGILLQKWYRDGKIFRANSKPHIEYRTEYLDSYDAWTDEDGELHRENDLPAIVYRNGTMEWWRHGKLYRDNGLPDIVYKNEN